MAIPHMPVRGQPHPDVFIIEGVLRNLQPGDSVPKQDLAAAIGMTLDDWKIVHRRVSRAKHRLRAREDINISAVPGVGYFRELPGQTVARVAEKERKSIRRKAHHSLQALRGVEVAALTSEQQHTYHATATIFGMTHRLNHESARQKVLAAVKVSRKQLPMADALEVLKNGGSDGQ